MKNVLLRAFVLVLSLAGIASTVGAKTIKTKTAVPGAPKHQVIPFPTCGQCLPD